MLRQVKMDAPQVTELGWRLAERGLPVRGPILTEEQLKEELMRIYDGKEDRGNVDED